MKSTLKRELKAPETILREGYFSSSAPSYFYSGPGVRTGCVLLLKVVCIWEPASRSFIMRWEACDRRAK